MASLWTAVSNWTRRSWLHVVLLFVIMLGFSLPLVMVVLLTTQEDPSPIVEELFAAVEGCTECRLLQRRVDALLATDSNTFFRGGGGSEVTPPTGREGSRSLKHLTVSKLLDVICIGGDTLPIRGVTAVAGGNCTALVKRLHVQLVDYLQSWKPFPGAALHSGNHLVRSSGVCPLFPPAVVVASSSTKVSTISSSKTNAAAAKRKSKATPSRVNAADGSGAVPATTSAHTAAAAQCLAQQLQFLESGTGPICYEICEGQLRVVDWAVVRVLRLLAYPSMRMFGAYLREFGGSVVLLVIQGFLIAFILQMRVYHNVLRSRVAAAMSIMGGGKESSSWMQYNGGPVLAPGSSGQHHSARDATTATSSMSGSGLRSKSGGVGGGAATTTAGLSASHRGKR